MVGRMRFFNRMKILLNFMTIGLPKRYDFIVTGASGSVGRQLIPILAGRGKRILAVGRDAAALQRLFTHITGVETTDYDGLGEQSCCDTLIHLAVHNNNKLGSLEDFNQVNVDFSAKICAEFNRMHGQRFINFASIQSLNSNSSSFYAASKVLAEKKMAQLVGHKLDNVHIGYFYSDSYIGEKLKFLERMGSLGFNLFRFFKILKPSTSANSLADYVCSPAGVATPNILTDDMSRSSLYCLLTRAMDVVVGAGILIFLLPIFIIVWVAIRLDSQGPGVFAQTRVGKGQELFTLYKFRTMKRGTTVTGTHEVSVSAVTKIGKFLRGTKLDELPQAINLLRGEMTLVGPRPCLPVQEELINARQALGVYQIKPGITGYAQIRDIDMSRPQELAQSDYIYTKLQSLVLNLKIILQTAFGHGRGDRVASDRKV